MSDYHNRSRNTGSGPWRRRHSPVLGKPGRQLEAVAVTCSEGHTFKVQARNGAVVKCAVCWQQRGDPNYVLVRRAQSDATTEA